MFEEAGSPAAGSGGDVNAFFASLMDDDDDEEATHDEPSAVAEQAAPTATAGSREPQPEQDASEPASAGDPMNKESEVASDDRSDLVEDMRATSLESPRIREVRTERPRPRHQWRMASAASPEGNSEDMKERAVRRQRQVEAPRSTSGNQLGKTVAGLLLISAAGFAVGFAMVGETWLVATAVGLAVAAAMIALVEVWRA